MSAVGGGGWNFGPLVNSTAGAAGQRRVAETDREQAESAERKFQLDQQAITEKMVGDVGASDETHDRDADGRQPWTIIRRKASGGDASTGHPPRAPDPDHERGEQLDLEA
jgi:hypothetical protein